MNTAEENQVATLFSLLNDQFKTALSRHKYIASVYDNLFKIWETQGGVEDTLSVYYNYFAEAENGSRVGSSWFEEFHKMFRQTDVFVDVNVRKHVNLLELPENKHLLDEFEKIRSVLKPEEEKWTDGNDPRKEKYSSFTSMMRGEYPDQWKRFCELRGMKNTHFENESVCGELDMVFWHTIYNDNEGILFQCMKHAFKKYKEIDSKS